MEKRTIIFRVGPEDYKKFQILKAQTGSETNEEIFKKMLDFSIGKTRVVYGEPLRGGIPMDSAGASSASCSPAMGTPFKQEKY